MIGGQSLLAMLQAEYRALFGDCGDLVEICVNGLNVN
jgi:hypothetical protein